MSGEVHLPTRYVTEMARQHPGCWREVDRLRAQRGKELPNWSSWCFLPLAGSYAILSGGKTLTPERASEIGVFAALAGWRPTQGIYEFHPSVLEALTDTPLTGDIPIEILYGLPEWCPYIRTPGRSYLGREMAGFFAYLESDANDGRQELRIVVDCPPTLISQLAIHLAGTLEEGIDAAKTEAAKQAARHGLPEIAQQIEAMPGGLIFEISPLVNLVLYLCARNCEIRDTRGLKDKPAHPPEQSTKEGPRLFPPDRATTWDVAYRTGAALAQAPVGGSSGTHSPDRAGPRPHIRRAHWHTYRTGTGRTNAELKWLAPIAVGVDEEHAIVPTIRGVQ